MVTELDENRKAFVPTYYGAKKWLPFLDAATYAEDFDALLRWVFDKPLDKPPPLGRPPAFLTEDEHAIRLATTFLQRRAVDAMKSGKSNALASLTEYLERVVDEFPRLRVSYKPDNKAALGDEMIHSIEAFLPYRNELIATFVTVAIYCNEQRSWEILHRFFEHLIPFKDRPDSMTSWNPDEFDNYNFIIWELFLYLVSSNLKYEKFDAVEYFLSARYYDGSSASQRDGRMKDFRVFWTQSRTLDTRQQQLRLNIPSLQSMLLKERNGGQSVGFDLTITADLILWLRSLDRKDGPWYPFTSAYISRYQPTVELFARAQSIRHFNKIKGMLGVKDLETLKAKVAEFDKGRDRPLEGGRSLNAAHVMDIGKIASIP